MMNPLYKTFLIFSLAIGASAPAADVNLLRNSNFATGMAQWKQSSLPCQIRGGKLIAKIPEDRSPYSSLLFQQVSLPGGKTYRLSFQIECKGKGSFRAVYQDSRKPYTNRGLAMNWTLGPGSHSLETLFTSSQRDGNPAQLTFNFSRLPGEVSLSHIRLEEVSLARIPFSLSPQWRVFWNCQLPTQWHEIPQSLDNQSGTVVPMQKGWIDLRQWKQGGFQPERSTAILYNQFDSTTSGLMRVGFCADWYFDIYFNGKRILTRTGIKPFSPDNCFEDLIVKQGSNLLVAVVRAGSSGWGFGCGIPRSPIIFQENSTWKKYQLTSPEIESGSALDLSGQVDRPAGKSGRLTISDKGELVFEKEHAKPVRLLGFNGMKNIFETKDDEAFKKRVQRFAQAARRQGYRLFRVHALLDRWLCQGATQDMAINPAYLDRWDYLISELKKEGIYIHLVIFSFHLYTKENSSAFEDRTQHKLMMYLNGKWEMDRFRYAVNTLFQHVNPYTGIAWKDDPAIAWVEYYNEQSLGLGGRMFSVLQKNPVIREHLLRCWHGWLEKKYGKSMQKAEIPTSAGEKLSNDFALFWMDQAKESALRCEKIIRGTGYQGLVSNYSYSKNLGHAAVRWETIPLVDVHAYFKHPSNWTQKGSVVESDSSIEEETGYWKDSNSVKLAGRPFISGEFNHCFWNPYRYESGMVFGGYSALQGYGALEIHEQPVILDDISKEAASCFYVGNSPLLRAAQFLTACLFQRGDVQTSPHQVALIVPQKFLRNHSQADKAVSPVQANIGLLAGFGLVFPGEPAAAGTIAQPVADLAFPISGSTEILSHDWFSEVVKPQNNHNAFSLDEAVAIMKEKGILSPRNISSPKQGIFQSDTEELLLKSREKKMTVITPRTEAICMTAGERESLKFFQVEKNSANSCIAACSIDNKPLATSRRIVLLYMTEEANSNMSLAANRATLLSLGSAPLLARTGVLELNVRRQGSWKLYALGMNGSRREEIPVRNSASGLKLRLDTASLQYGPTPFFELVADQDAPERKVVTE